MTDFSRKIGYVVKTFPKISETFILQEILDLEAQGLDLTIFSLQHPTDDEFHPSVSRVQAKIEYYHPQGSPQDSPELRQDFQANWLIRQLLKHRIHHTHAHFASEPTGVAERAYRATGIPFSFTAHAKDIYLTSETELAYKIHQAQFVLTCTDYNTRILERLSTGHTPIIRVYHGLDLTKFQPRPANSTADQRDTVPRILSIGRYREKKGFPTLIQACAALKQQGYRFYCHIIGYGPLQDHLQALIVDSQLNDCVFLVGKMAHNGLLDWYRQADLFVLPCQIADDGDRDGIPNVLVEALAMGLPVVSTNIASIPELIQNEKTGLLVEPKNPIALAAAIGKLLDHPTLGSILAKQGRETVMKSFFSFENSAAIKDLFAESPSSSSVEDETPEYSTMEDPR
jgi:glycosyltransferase involved in cell wall biosynthesis